MAQQVFIPLTSCSFCCLLRSSVCRSEGAVSSSLCRSSLRCSNTRFSSGFFSGSRPLHSQWEEHTHTRSNTHAQTLLCSYSRMDDRENKVGQMFSLPFMAEHQLPVQVMVAWCFHRGTIQFPGVSNLITAAVCCGLTVQEPMTNIGLWRIGNNFNNCNDWNI